HIGRIGPSPARMVGYPSSDYFQVCQSTNKWRNAYSALPKWFETNCWTALSRLAVSLGIHKHHLSGRNLFTAKVVRTIKSSKMTPCAIANGGSFCVGAIALSDGTFSNDCTTKTKTLKYNAMHAATTKVFLQVRCSRYRVTTAMANT